MTTAASRQQEDPVEFDFDKQRTLTDYVTVPAGTYLCRIAEVRSGATRAGDERWSMKLVVAEGQHVGKQAAWDSLVFSARGQARARLVLQALGLPHTGVVQIEPHDLEGREALVEVRPAEYQSPTGAVVRRNEVPYDGFRAADGATGAGSGVRGPARHAGRGQSVVGAGDVREDGRGDADGDVGGDVGGDLGGEPAGDPERSVGRDSGAGDCSGGDATSPTGIRTGGPTGSRAGSDVVRGGRDADASNRPAVGAGRSSVRAEGSARRERAPRTGEASADEIPF